MRHAGHPCVLREMYSTLNPRVSSKEKYPMFSLLIAVAMLPMPSSPGASAAWTWTAAAEQLRSVAETYKKWGITFKVEKSGEFVAATSPVPSRLEVTGAIESPDTLTLSVNTTVGEKNALAVHLGGNFKIDPNGTATEGAGAVYVEGRGLAGKFKYDRETGITLEAGVEETFYSLGIKLGEADAGPFALGLKLGPLSVDIDPTKWVRRFVEMAPTLTKQGAARIGGVTLQMNSDALAAAIREADKPPAAYLMNREAVSLKGLLAAGTKDLGRLTSVEGLLVDSARHDIVLVGSHDASLRPIPVDLLTVLVRTVYEAGTHPYVSIDPQAGDFGAPHRARIGGIPTSLHKSALIDVMLTADYSMKQLVMSKHRVEGVPGMMDLSSEFDPRKPEQWRFWITPVPPSSGDIALSHGATSRYYRFVVQPQILAETTKLSGGNATDADPLVLSSSPDTDLSRPTRATLLAQTYTQRYAAIESEWPESQFGSARQALQLAGVISLAASREREPWELALFHRIGVLSVALCEIRTSFPSLTTTRPGPDGAATIAAQGGMQTDILLPAPSVGIERISDADIKWTSWHGSLAPLKPTASEPAALSESAAAEMAKEDAMRALSSSDWGAAKLSARFALRIKPHWDDAEALLISALARANDKTTITELETAIGAMPKSLKLLAISASLSEAQENWYELRKIATKLIALQPTYAPGYAFRAQGLYRGGDSAALADWNTAIRLDPQNPEYRMKRAAFYLWQGMQANAASNLKDKALSDLDAAIQVAPTVSNSYLIKGELLEKLNRYPESVNALESAVKLAPSDWLAHDLLGRAQFLAGDLTATVESMSIAYAIRPRDPLFELVRKYDGVDEPPTDVFRIPKDPLEQYIDSPDVEHKPMITELTVFDPLIVLLRGAANFKLGHFADASKDLTLYLKLGERYRKASEARVPMDRVGDVSKMLDICRSKLQ